MENESQDPTCIQKPTSQTNNEEQLRLRSHQVSIVDGVLSESGIPIHIRAAQPVRRTVPAGLGQEAVVANKQPAASLEIVVAYEIVVYTGEIMKNHPTKHTQIKHTNARGALLVETLAKRAFELDDGLE